ncbi:hypothetical protein CN090_13245 [Sinorhizobium meliloti]|uniref:DUF6074 family protein n=1 Tax=Rhizobium meliloti TaxID=382 RepID=UPI000FDC318C|nr:DUF6074 family protein [Sinorhizobium meliloti]RVO50835.1 hypothetical protein CN090_13245 [Sinorhizobium meliloti]
MTETQILVFPLTRRVGKIRAVAATLMGMKTEKMARAYRMQITAGLLNNLGRLGVATVDQHEPIFQFWRAVHDEIAKNLEGAA